MKQLTMFLVSLMSIVIIGMLALFIWAFRGVDWNLVIDSIIKNSVTTYSESNSQPLIIINQESPINTMPTMPPGQPETAVFATLTPATTEKTPTPETAVYGHSTRPGATVTYQAACVAASGSGRRSNPQCNPSYAPSTPAGVGR